MADGLPENPACARVRRHRRMRKWERLLAPASFWAAVLAMLVIANCDHFASYTRAPSSADRPPGDRARTTGIFHCPILTRGPPCGRPANAPPVLARCERPAGCAVTEDAGPCFVGELFIGAMTGTAPDWDGLDCKNTEEQRRLCPKMADK